MADRFWFNDGVKEYLIRENQPIPEGLVPGRIEKPSRITELKKLFSKETIYQLYIVENISFNELFERLNISRRDLKLLLHTYKITKNHKSRAKNNTYRRSQEEIRAVAAKSSATQKRTWAAKSEKEKEDWSNYQKELHHTEEYRRNASERSKRIAKELKEASPEIWAQRNKKRSETCKKTWANEAPRIQQHETRERNRLEQKKKLCRTIAEQKLYDTLKNIYPDIAYDIKVDERYPFYCDFYIKSLDLFIELNAHPSHGRLPMEMMSVDEYSKYPPKWADVFAKRDVEKLKHIRDNKLNFIRIYPQATLEENYKVNEDKNKELIDICYKSQKQR